MNVTKEATGVSNGTNILYCTINLLAKNKKKQSDHQNNLKESNENGATVISAFSQQAPKLFRGKKEKEWSKIPFEY